MSNPYFKQTDPQYKLRWPEELRDKVAASAKAYNRSMNADIVARLERSFLTEPDFSPLNMPPEELAKRLKTASNLTETGELNIEVSSTTEQDKKIEELEKRLEGAMKTMEIMSGFFESMLNDTQEEYMESVFQKYPKLKNFYARNGYPKKDPE